MAPAVRLCDALLSTHAFHHYEYGDCLPIHARYYGEEGLVEEDEAIVVYLRCARAAGHPGKHLAPMARAAWD